MELQIAIHHITCTLRAKIEKKILSCRKHIEITIIYFVTDIEIMIHSC